MQSQLSCATDSKANYKCECAKEYSEPNLIAKLFCNVPDQKGSRHFEVTFKSRGNMENKIVLSTSQDFINCLEFYSGEGSISLLSAGCSDKVIIWSCHLVG